MHFRQIGVNTSRHAPETEEVHGKKSKIETDKEKPKMNFAEGFIKHPPGHLGNPVIQAGKHREESAANQDIMKMRDDKIAVMDLKVHGNRRKHDAG